MISKPRMARERPGRRAFRARDVDLLGQTEIVAVRLEPLYARMVLHGAESRVVMLNPDLQLLHLGSLFLRQ